MQDYNTIIGAIQMRLNKCPTRSVMDDKPCMKPLPGGEYTTCDYKAVLKVPNNYHMSELIDRILKSSKHEEQAFNACAGILYRVKAIPKGIAEEAARKCIEMNSCRYSTYRQVLKKMECDEHPESSPESLPSHENIRGNRISKICLIISCYSRFNL